MTVKRTRLCYWIRRSRYPKTPVECVSLPFRTHMCVLAFSTDILYINGIEMAPDWLIWKKFSYIIFKFAICFITLMHFGEARHLKRPDMVTVWWTMLLLCCYKCWLHATALWRHAFWRHTMHEWVMNSHYQTWIAQGRLTNIILTPWNQWGVYDNILCLLIPLPCRN